MFVILTESLFANGLFYCEGLDSTTQVALFCNDYENTQVSFISINDNIFDILGFVPTNSKFVPQSAVNYYLSQGRALLNNISNFFISVDYTNSFLTNGQINSVIYVQPITVDANETQTIQPFNPIFSAFSKSILIDQITVMLTGDNNSTIDNDQLKL